MHKQELITMAIVSFFILVMGAWNPVFGQEIITPIGAQPTPNQNADRLAKPGINLQAPLDQGVIDEINKIRQQLGGGISVQLKGMEWRSPWNNNPQIVSDLNQDFDQELQRLASRQPTSAAGELAASVKSGSQRQWPSTELDQSKIRRLRDSARRLDEMAAELEEVSLFGDADQIRAQAREFWLKARQGGALSIDNSSRN